MIVYIAIGLGCLVLLLFGVCAAMLSSRISQDEERRQVWQDAYREGRRFGFDEGVANQRGCSVDTVRQMRNTAGRAGWNARLGAPGEGSAVTREEAT